MTDIEQKASKLLGFECYEGTNQWWIKARYFIPSPASNQEVQAWRVICDLLAKLAAQEAELTALRELRKAVKPKQTNEQADEIEAEMRRLENDPTTTKHEFRLFMQSLMPCGHAVGELLTCSDPPYGCNECNHIDKLLAAYDAAEAAKEN